MPLDRRTKHNYCIGASDAVPLASVCYSILSIIIRAPQMILRG